jgi:hypothetical protein
MNGMTVTTTQLGGTHGMMRGLIKIRTFFLMAGETHIRLGYLVEHAIMRSMNCVATGAGNLVDLMRTTLPGDMGIALVTLQAHAVLYGYGLVRFGTEIDDRRPLLSWPYLANVTTRPQGLFHEQLSRDARSMARLTLQPGKWRTGIRLHGMLGLEDIQDRVFRILVVTLDTCIGALLGIFHGTDRLGGLIRSGSARAYRLLCRLRCLLCMGETGCNETA